MNSRFLWPNTGLAFVLSAGAAAANAKGGIASRPNKGGGASSHPAADMEPAVAAAFTISAAPKKTNKAKAAPAAASK